MGGGDAASAASAVLERGEADYAWNLQVEPETLASMEAAGLGELIVSFTILVERIVVNQTNADPALGDDRSEYLDGENPHPFLTFKPIRQAMSMAIDRGLIATQLYGFAAKPTCNLVTGPPNYASTANDGCLSQDIEGANSLLDDNGVLDADGDGVREYNGVPLRIVFQTSTNPIREDTQALVRDWWRQIGIETELKQHDASVFFGGDPVVDKEASFRRFFARRADVRRRHRHRPSASPIRPSLQAYPDSGQQLGPSTTSPALATRSTTRSLPNWNRPRSGRTGRRW